MIKSLLITFVVVALLLTIGLPLYLGPDDLSGCSRPEEYGKCEKADAIIALSGGDTSARTAEAIRLYKDGWASKLMFSGAAADKTGPSNAEVMRKQAIEGGVPASAITIEELSANTAENAQNTAEVVKKMNLNKVILVTSVYHQRRASIEFGKRLGDEVKIINHPVANDNQWSSWWWMTPYGWVLGLGEVIKIIFAEASGL